MDSDASILARLDIDPTSLDPAPPWPASRAARERLGPPDSVPCSVCGRMAIATRIVNVDQPRWLNMCRRDLLKRHGKADR